MRNKYLVSVCIPTYNREKYIGEAIESVLAQDYKNLEIVIVDDGSTDNTSDIVKEFQEKDSRIKFFKQKHKGISAARITCVEKSRGWALAWLDSDDFLTTNYAISKLAIIMINDPSVGFVYSNYYYQKWGILQGTNRQIRMPYDSNLKKFASSSWQMFTREAYNKTSGFDLRLTTAEDYDIAMKLEEVTKLKFVDEMMYFIRVHQTNITRTEEREKRKRNRERARKAAKKRRGIS